jgi:hypothetical protein
VLGRPPGRPRETLPGSRAQGAGWRLYRTMPIRPLPPIQAEAHRARCRRSVSRDRGGRHRCIGAGHLGEPEVGNLVPGTGGLRKVRLGQRQVGRGKRGGLRVYYLDLAAAGITHLVAIFGKREKADLSPAERKAVAALVRTLKEEAS